MEPRAHLEPSHLYGHWGHTPWLLQIFGKSTHRRKVFKRCDGNDPGKFTWQYGYRSPYGTVALPLLRTTRPEQVPPQFIPNE